MAAFDWDKEVVRLWPRHKIVHFAKLEAGLRAKLEERLKRDQQMRDEKAREIAAVRQREALEAATRHREARK